MQRIEQRFQLPMDVNVKLIDLADQVVAHALDFYVVAVAESVEEAKRRLALLVKVHVEYGLKYNNVDYIVFPAPESYWEDPEGTFLVGRLVRIGEGGEVTLQLP
jgi:hypothetical protein